MAERLKSEEKGAWRKSWQSLAKAPATKAFTEQLDEAALAYFTSVAQKPFSQQAVAFLNAYWPEVGGEAQFIFDVSWDMVKKADMRAKGIQLLHEYDEGRDLDFDIGLYLYEQLCKFVEDPKNKNYVDNYPRSQPEMMTALARKQELREKVDVNFDGRISFLEYLLYQYKDVANPADFVQRSMGHDDEHPEIRKARLALEEVNKRIKAFEAEKARLEAESQLPGVKGLAAKNQLAQIFASPLAEELNRALITAEAAVRIAVKKFSGQSGRAVADGVTGASSEGACFWMNADLEDKKKRYGKKK